VGVGQPRQPGGRQVERDVRVVDQAEIGADLALIEAGAQVTLAGVLLEEPGDRAAGGGPGVACAGDRIAADQRRQQAAEDAAVRRGDPAGDPARGRHLSVARPRAVDLACADRPDHRRQREGRLGQVIGASAPSSAWSDRNSPTGSGSVRSRPRPRSSERRSSTSSCVCRSLDENVMPRAPASGSLTGAASSPLTAAAVGAAAALAAATGAAPARCCAGRRRDRAG
jgi:hypothetical protein